MVFIKVFLLFAFTISSVRGHGGPVLGGAKTTSQGTGKLNKGAEGKHDKLSKDQKIILMLFNFVRYHLEESFTKEIKNLPLLSKGIVKSAEALKRNVHYQPTYDSVLNMVPFVDGVIEYCNFFGWDFLDKFMDKGKELANTKGADISDVLKFDFSKMDIKDDAIQPIVKKIHDAFGKTDKFSKSWGTIINIVKSARDSYDSHDKWKANVSELRNEIKKFVHLIRSEAFALINEELSARADASLAKTVNAKSRPGYVEEVKKVYGYTVKDDLDELFVLNDFAEGFKNIIYSIHVHYVYKTKQAVNKLEEVKLAIKKNKVREQKPIVTMLDTIIKIERNVGSAINFQFMEACNMYLNQLHSNVLLAAFTMPHIVTNEHDEELTYAGGFYDDLAKNQIVKDELQKIHMEVEKLHTLVLHGGAAFLGADSSLILHFKKLMQMFYDVRKKYFVAYFDKNIRFNLDVSAFHGASQSQAEDLKKILRAKLDELGFNKM